MFSEQAPLTAWVCPTSSTIYISRKAQAHKRLGDPTWGRGWDGGGAL